MIFPDGLFFIPQRTAVDREHISDRGVDLWVRVQRKENDADHADPHHEARS
jgi:hypothetical protein